MNARIGESGNDDTLCSAVNNAVCGSQIEALRVRQAESVPGVQPARRAVLKGGGR